MTQASRKRTAKVKLTLTKRTVEALEPGASPWIAWDDRLTGFGVRVQPSGTKAFVVHYRSGGGGRRAPNRRVVIGRYGAMTPDKARRVAQEVLGRVAVGDDPAAERDTARRMPLLREAFAEFLAANPNRKPITLRLYRGQIRYCFGDWMARPLDTITRRDVEARFHLLTERHGWAIAKRVRQVSNDDLKVQQGSLRPALYRLEKDGWIAGRRAATQTGREAKFYSLTSSGREHLQREVAVWERFSGAIDLVGEEA